MEYGHDDDTCHEMLLSMIKNIPFNNLVSRLVSKLLSICMRLSKKESKTSSAPGSKVKQILLSINEHYSQELRETVQSFLKDTEMQSKKDKSAYEILCKTLDGGFDSSFASSDSYWLARVRHATVVSLDADSNRGDNANSQKLQTIHDALLCRLYDDDLSVVQAALSMGRLSEFIKQTDLLDALQKVFRRCINILTSQLSDFLQLPSLPLCKIMLLHKNFEIK